MSYKWFFWSLDTWYLILDTWCFDTWYLILDSWYLIADTMAVDTWYQERRNGKYHMVHIVIIECHHHFVSWKNFDANESKVIIIAISLQTIVCNTAFICICFYTHIHMYIRIKLALAMSFELLQTIIHRFINHQL